MSKEIAFTTLELDTNKPHVTARCPCGGQYTAGESKCGEAFVLHTMPPCDNYMKMNVLDFLKSSRLNGAKPISGGTWKD